jgi:hypothetical protein
VSAVVGGATGTLALKKNQELTVDDFPSLSAVASGATTPKASSVLRNDSLYEEPFMNGVHAQSPPRAYKSGNCVHGE